MILKVVEVEVVGNVSKSRSQPFKVVVFQMNPGRVPLDQVDAELLANLFSFLVPLVEGWNESLGAHQGARSYNAQLLCGARHQPVVHVNQAMGCNHIRQVGNLWHT